METEPDPLASAPRRVEAYLDQILAPLTRRLSPFHRDELRRELREHLWARIESYRELDHSEGEAVTEALRQFGGAEDFLRQWRREWTKSPQKITLREVWQAAWPAFWLSPLMLISGLLPIFLWLYAYSFLHSVPRLSSWLDHYSPWLGGALFGVDVFLLPILLGFAVARRSPQRAGLGMFMALSTQVTLWTLLYWISTRLWPGQLIVDNLTSGLFLETAWLPLSCTSATFGGWMIRRSKTRHLA